MGKCEIRARRRRMEDGWRAGQFPAIAGLRSQALVFLLQLPGVVALTDSRSTPGYYRPPCQGFQSALIASRLGKVWSCLGRKPFQSFEYLLELGPRPWQQLREPRSGDAVVHLSVSGGFAEDAPLVFEAVPGAAGAGAVG